MLRSIILTVASLLGTSGALSTRSSIVAEELYRFPNETFIENVAVLSDGRLLLNTFDQARVYIFDPSVDNPEPYVLANVPGINQLTGIAEVAPNVFAVSGGIEGADYAFVNGSAIVATVNLNACAGESMVSVRARIPNTTMLNGMVALPDAPHVVLSADSIGGRLFRTDTATGIVDVVLHSELLGPGPDPQIVPLGANGLEIHDGYLYYTNSNQQFFARIKINKQGDQFGDVEEIYRLTESFGAFDDFSMTRAGVAYVGQQRDSLVRITQDGQLTTLLSPDSEIKLDQPTSVALTADESAAFVVTGGMDGRGGQVIRVWL